MSILRTAVEPAHIDKRQRMQQERREMEIVEFLIPTAPPISQNIQETGNSDFLVTLIAMAGHDLRQPLQLITSAHDALATMPLTGEQRQELAEAREASAQLARMLGQLVEAVQLHERAREDLAAPVLLRPILEDLTAEFEAPARLKGIDFRVANSRNVALSHPALLIGILRNLVRNAIDYTPPGGSVFVTSRQRGPELHISVRDTGVGIPADALSKIFDAFERVDQSRGDGLGLGLFIAKRAADLLGHRIEVQSVQGFGSCFSLRTSRAERFPMKRVA
jgi:two-component system, OmpR family, phosphate regulon sensor histidine kinase PhoR